MSDWIVAPVVLPALTAAFLVLAARFDLRLQRAVSIGSTVALSFLVLGLFLWSLDGTPRIYALGNWPVPFGIVLVLDRLSALMLLLTAVLGIALVVYVTLGTDRRGRHFHALFQFQLMGVNGAFLTGDIFNLFVFFEVLLIASYGLLLHGGGVRRFGAGIHYIAINLVGSILFLFAVGLIYGVTGTLNMADLALKVGRVPAADEALLRTGALLLLVVFAIKAALVPLHVWLPGTYGAAAPAVTALFAILSKVGAYAILRVFTLIFGVAGGGAAWAALPWVTPAALLTAIVGAVGVLGATSLNRLACFALLHSMGTLLIAVGLFQPAALASALYYLVHSTLAIAALFLVLDLVIRRRDGAGDQLRAAPPIPHENAIGAIFFITAIAIAGLPPLSGFVGKLLVLDAARGDAAWIWIWVVILSTSLIVSRRLCPRGLHLVLEECGTPCRFGPEAAERHTARPHRPIAAAGAFDPVHARRRIRHGLVHGPCDAAHGPARLRRGRARRWSDGSECHRAHAMMRRILPQPLMTLALAALWMMLIDSVSPGSIVMGLIVGVIVPLFTHVFWPSPPRPRRLGLIIVYIFVVIKDVVLANLEVARVVLFKPNRDLRPAFMTIPLDLETPEAITVLASTITMTPGTLSADICADGRSLLIHGLDVPDQEAVILDIKERYEKRLRGIFQ